MMLGTLVRETSGLLERRFLLNAFLPVLAAVTVVAAVAAYSAWGLHTSVSRWRSIGATGQILTTLVIFVGSSLFASLLSVMQASVLRWYEGQWHSPPGRYWKRWGRTWHTGRFNKLAERAGESQRFYWQIHLNYPLPGQEELVMPTRLGNVLRNSELHARDRYGIDVALVWPRLFPLLPDRVVQAISAARADLELMVNLSCLAGLTGSVAAVIALACSAHWWVFLACLDGGALVALLAYLGAVSAARTYAQQVKVTFDVFRGSLLQHLGAAPPAVAQPDGEAAVDMAEPEVWQRLALYWFRATPNATEDPHDTEPLTENKRAVLPLSAVALLAILMASLVGTLILA